jgi:hypothetical protein
MNDWISVTSSSLSRIRWDEQTSTLEIEFIGGRVYQYFDVPAPLFEAFQTSDSYGRFFQQNIRGHYRYVQL